MAIDKGVLELNSTYLEYTDRFFLLRGWGFIAGVLSASLLVPGILPLLWAISDIYQGGRNSLGENIALVIFGITVISLSALMMRAFLFRDALGYTYSPIRFNRIERNIYVFNGDYKGNALTIPWESAFMFIGCGRPVGGGSQDSTYDLRCHVLDDSEVVRHTFAIGHHCGNSKAEVLQHWEMIRRYMDEGPEALPFPPLALYLSTEPTLRNAFIIQVGGMGDGWLRIVAGVFTVPWAIARYLALKTCKRPRWPRGIEQACQIDPDDPYRQSRPQLAGDAQTTGPDGDERYFAYVETAAEEADEYDDALRKTEEVSA